MPATLINGDQIKALKSKLQLFNSAAIGAGSDDPSSTPINGNPGDIYVSTSTLTTYQKQDSGVSTNWGALATTANSANIYLSNLGPTAVNVNLNPGFTQTYGLGEYGKLWQYNYLNFIFGDNIVEGLSGYFGPAIFTTFTALIDANGFPSYEWTGRKFYDSTGITVSGDYESRFLRDEFGGQSVWWAEQNGDGRVLVDVNNNRSLNWSARVLLHEYSAAAMNWSNAITQQIKSISMGIQPTYFYYSINGFPDLLFDAEFTSEGLNANYVTAGSPLLVTNNGGVTITGSKADLSAGTNQYLIYDNTMLNGLSALNNKGTIRFSVTPNFNSGDPIADQVVFSTAATDTLNSVYMVIGNSGTTVKYVLNDDNGTNVFNTGFPSEEIPVTFTSGVEVEFLFIFDLQQGFAQLIQDCNTIASSSTTSNRATQNNPMVGGLSFGYPVIGGANTNFLITDFVVFNDVRQSCLTGPLGLPYTSDRDFIAFKDGTGKPIVNCDQYGKLNFTASTAVTSVTTSPQILFEPLGTTSNNWSSDGTIIGINQATGFAGTSISVRNESVRFLDVIGNDTNGYSIDLYSYNFTPTLHTYGSGGTSAAPTDTTATQALGSWSFRGRDSNGYTGAGSVHITGNAYNSWTPSDHSAYLTFSTTPSGTTSDVERLRINASGNVSIGNTNDTYKLDVSGVIRATGGFIGSSAGDINETSFSLANNQAVASNVTGLAFANGVVRSAEVLYSIYIDATSPLYESGKLYLIQKASTWTMSQTTVGDVSGVIFTVTNTGQIQYTDSNYTGFVSGTLKFRAISTSV